MRKFRFILIGSLSAIILAIVAVLITTSYSSFKAESVSLNKANLQEKNATIEASLAVKFSAYQDVISAVNVSDSDMGDGKLSTYVITQLQTLQKAQRSITDGIYLFRKNGDIYDVNGKPLHINVKELNREYYNAVFNQGVTFYVSAPFNSAVSGKEVLGMAYRIDESSAILSNIFLASVLGDLVERKDMFMYTNNGTILIAPNKNLVGKDIFTERPLYKQFNATNHELSYTVNTGGMDTDFTAFWSELEVNGWGFVSFVADSVIKKQANAQLISALIIGFISLIVAILFLLFLINKLVLKPIGGAPEDIESLMASMADGDLSQDLKKTGTETGSTAL